MPPSNLTALANHFGTDKGTSEGHAHDYTRLYSFLFEQFRTQPFTMLEIGLHRGGVEGGGTVDRVVHQAPSIQMWLNYFPNAFCYGFDLSDFSTVVLDRFAFIRGDLSSQQDLDGLAARLPPLRLLVDDGSHASFHQQFAFTRLFHRIAPGGFYVIEDFHWQPAFEDALPACRKTADVFETFLETGKLDLPFTTPEWLQAAQANIRNVFVHRDDRGGVDRWRMKMVAIQTC
jgi:hypothetical protein